MPISALASKANIGLHGTRPLDVTFFIVATSIRCCDGVFAVIDTASKTGTDHDATAVTFFALDKLSRRAPLLILDWDIAQIEGALLETWLPMVFERLEELSRLCGARHRLGWRMDRGQKLRNNPVTAGYPQAMASNPH